MEPEYTYFAPCLNHGHGSGHTVAAVANSSTLTQGELAGRRFAAVAVVHGKELAWQSATQRNSEELYRRVQHLVVVVENSILWDIAKWVDDSNRRVVKEGLVLAPGCRQMVM